MSETGVTTVNRTGWTSGPWDSEVDRYEWRDAATGLPCLIVRNRIGALCGYAGVQPGHPWHGKDYNDVPPVDVHGGLTYANKCGGGICHVAQPGEPDDVWWLGFDTAHSGDLVPGSEAFNRRMWAETHEACWRTILGEDTYRDVSYVRAEVAALALQIAQAGQ